MGRSPNVEQHIENSKNNIASEKNNGHINNFCGSKCLNRKTKKCWIPPLWGAYWHTTTNTPADYWKIIPKHRLISISIFKIPLKIYIVIHNWTSKPICSIRYTPHQYSICVYFILGSQEMTVFKNPKKHKKSAAEGGRLLWLLLASCVQSFPGSPK